MYSGFSVQLNVKGGDEGATLRASRLRLANRERSKMRRWPEGPEEVLGQDWYISAERRCGMCANFV